MALPGFAELGLPTVPGMDERLERRRARSPPLGRWATLSLPPSEGPSDGGALALLLGILKTRLKKLGAGGTYIANN